MVSKNINLTGGGRLVIAESNADIYLQDPVPVHNFTAVNNKTNESVTSGTISISTFPSSGIDACNVQLGVIGTFDLATSGTQLHSSVFDVQYKRGNIPISGSKFIGRI